MFALLDLNALSHYTVNTILISTQCLYNILRSNLSQDTPQPYKTALTELLKRDYDCDDAAMHAIS
ncbi:hypothetical protein EJ02DRAFT_161564 [Clathrospora elynae]|uniref:Uncharacterized protein n=1 Tax=Clathrospora elynae TaxID=706981 RepID=A0A6A5S5H2_9PLEO|nr:hypothetical protein EJ02DRAFT_161564 [Clathrospora elynae]